MKSTGILRPVDKLGRVVIPTEIRRQFGIVNEVDSLEIFLEDDKIILKKYQPCCHFCGSLDDCISFKGKLICGVCIEKLGLAYADITAQEAKQKNE